MKRTIVLLAAVSLGCAEPSATPGLSTEDRDAIRVEVETALRNAYDLSIPQVPERMLALYADSGRVISATSGNVTTSRDSIAAGIRYFWDNVGVNMRDPKWEWGEMFIDVLSPTSAVVTATYRIPHLNPSNQPHLLGGAMTLVMRKRNGRWEVIQEHLSDLPQTAEPSASDSTHEDH
jgi:hypothetical protein